MSIKSYIERVQKSYNAGYYIATHPFRKVDCLQRFEYQGTTIEVVRDEKYVLASSGKLCCVTKEPTRIVISVDEEFMELDEATQSFIIFHELGHICNGHIDEKINRFKDVYLRNIIGWFKVPSSEALADEYTLKHMSKEIAIKCMRKIYEIIPKRELKLRIRLMEQK